MGIQPIQRPAPGFTLIELMVVVAVVAILASIAIPAYHDSVRKGRRGQAKADLVELAQTLERHYTVHGRYDTNRDGSAYALPFTSSPKTGTQNYTLAAAARTQTTFQLTATPVAGTDQARDVCGTLSIDHAGVKAATGGTAERCF
jgi:type IV pilus assembly protein PilE